MQQQNPIQGDYKPNNQPNNQHPPPPYNHNQAANQQYPTNNQHQTPFNNNQPGYNPQPPSQQNNLVPPPHQNNLNQPPQQNYFGAPQQNNLVPPPHQNNLNQPPQQNYFGAPQQNNLGPSQQNSSNAVQQNNVNPPPQQNTSNNPQKTLTPPPGSSGIQQPLTPPTTGNEPKVDNTEQRKLIQSKPYSQTLEKEWIIYSLIPKSRQTFFGTNERLLLLKGLDSISYSRQLPTSVLLPFTSFQSIPKPKVIVPLSEVQKCQTQQNKLKLTFSGGSRPLWQFQCPTKLCAKEWSQKIESAMLILNDFKHSGHPNINEYYKMRREQVEKKREADSHQVQNMLGQNATGTLGQNNNNPFVTPKKGEKGEGNDLVHSIAATFGSNLQMQNPPQPAPHLSSPQADFIAAPQDNSMTKSVSKFTVSQKEALRGELLRLRRNWIQELIGGEEQVQLIMDFKNYVEKAARLVISELSLPQNLKLFAPVEQSKEHAMYLLDDIKLQIYFHIPQTMDQKHPRYELACLEFKNLNYLLTVTKNEDTLKVPFMVLFEYKGFLGMAKSRIGDPNTPPRNRDYYSQINIREFEETARISAQTLLNEQKCKIIEYKRKTSLSATLSNRKIYFVEHLTELLPLEKENNSLSHVLRAQFLQDETLDGIVFRDKRRPVYREKLSQLIDNKIKDFIFMIEQQEEYFTNSKELAELMHLSGLNIRHLGLVYQRSRLGWFRRVLKAELIARAIKSIFRFDVQNAVLSHTGGQDNQDQIEKRRVISFLNIIFGNSLAAAELWKKINAISRQKFGVTVTENGIGDTNTQYLLQAVQTHLKIVLNESIHHKLKFQSNQTFDLGDFQRFEFRTSIYDLEFSNLFDQINQCLLEENSEAFYNLSAILIKETSTRIPYLQILKQHPIHSRISEFLLNFTSPAESQELYTRLQSGTMPSRFLYESKLAEMKWYLKYNKPDNIRSISVFIFEHARKWLGAVHPLFAQLNRIQASYYSDHIEYFQTALKHANESLEMQKKIFDGEAEPLWKDYFLLGKIYFLSKNYEEGMKLLLKARQMVNTKTLTEFETFSELNILLCKGYFGAQRYAEAFAAIRDLYATIKGNSDQKSLYYSIEVAHWMQQLYEVSQDSNGYLQFLEVEMAQNIKNFAEYPQYLANAVKVVTFPWLRHSVLTKSRNTGKLMGMVEEIGRIAQSTQNTLAGYLRDKIMDSSFPRTFLLQLKNMDAIHDEIMGSGQLLERWRQFYLSSSQGVLDQLSRNQIDRGFELMANLTALFNLFGKQVMDDLRSLDRR